MNSLFLFIVSGVAHHLPETRFFGFKRWLYNLAGAKIGKGTKITSSVKILGAGNLTIGENTWVGHDTMIVCANSVTIGSNCDLGPRVYIGDGTHVIDTNCSHVAGPGTSKPVFIGDGCWLCANCTILPGVSIAEKCIVAAGSVVTHSFNEPVVLLGGVPCDVKKSLLTKRIVNHE